MVSESASDVPASDQDSSQDPSPRRGVDWSDPTIPAGNAPPMPRWPLLVWALLWVAWLVFLVVMLWGSSSVKTVS